MNRREDIGEVCQFDGFAFLVIIPCGKSPRKFLGGLVKPAPLVEKGGTINKKDSFSKIDCVDLKKGDVRRKETKRMNSR